jgi:hypothetical protein
MSVPRFLSPALLRPVRLLPVQGKVPFDPHSPEYLYLVQQTKRISLVRTLNRFRLGNLLLWPALLAIVLLKWADLALSTTLIRSLINEYDLLQKLEGTGTRPNEQRCGH